MTTSSKPTKPKLIPKRQIKADIVRNNLHKSIKSFKLQRTGCWNPASKIKIDRCKPCIAKKNEGCRFINIRAFPTSAFESATSTTEYKENDIVLEDNPYFMDYDGPDPVSKYKKSTTMTITKTNYRNIVLQKFCKAFTQMLQEDSQRVIEHGTLIRRRAPLDNVRHVCDMCLTSIFNLHYMCSVCALDLCVDCYDKNWEEKQNSKLAQCTYRRKHTKEHMVPVIKYKTATLEQFKEQSSKMDEDSKKDNTLYSNMTSTDTRLNESVSTKTTKDENIVAKDEAFMSDENDFLIVDADDLTLDSFRTCWGMGKPVMVKNVMDKDSQELWSPETFINKYSVEEKEDGSKKRKIKVKTMTEVINCENGFVHETSVENFFEEYINPTLRKGYKEGEPVVLKIKDWPPKHDFVEQFPDLYTDFMRILPAKEYCTVNGYFNLSNRLPIELLPPDLGPKMFIAYGSDQGEQSVGTTKLHCDMADAVNVMCHANKSDDCAAAIWDIFPYESMSIIRSFVKKIALEQNRKIIDPIHDQWLYLNDTLLERLEKEHGVKSWRLYQNPGDAVFIPAGCAHQVSNYHSAIKCAYDFVSPENVERCLDITRQFGCVRREDALQLKSTLLFAWSKLYSSD